jgi:hypothetical protein
MLNSQVVTIDTNTTFQTIHSWEAGTSVVITEGENIATDPLIDIVKYDVAKYIVDTVGINRLRLEVRAGSENTRDYWNEYITEQVSYEDWRANRYANVNDNDDPDDLNMAGFYFSELDDKINNAVLPMKEYMESKGEKLYISLCYVAFTEQITDGEYIHRDPKEYAEFILAVFTYMKDKYDFVPDAVEVFLEPDVGKFGNGDLVGKCLVETGDKLKSEGYSPEFIALSNTNLFNANNTNYIGKFLEVSRVLDYWKEYSYHAYAGRTDSLLNAVAERANQYNVRTSMLEWWTNSNTSERLHTDLKIGNNSTWQYRFSLATSENSDNNSGLTKVTYTDENNFKIEPKFGVPFVAFYQRNIRPGDVRIDANSDDNNVDVIAFKTPDGRIKIIANCLSQADIYFNNLPKGEYVIKSMIGDPKKLPSKDETSYKDEILNDGNVLSAQINGQGILIVEQINNQLSSVKDSELIIYPNPTTNILNIDIEGRFSYKIFDIQGKLILEGNSKNQIDLKSISIGKYILEINSNNSKFTKSIIKTN